MTDEGGSKCEVLEGYVVDQACLRKYPQDELLERARTHTTECALMGHCMESGYGLVNEEARPLLLEPSSTTQIVEALRRTAQKEGVRLCAMRQMQEQEMRTLRVHEV